MLRCWLLFCFFQELLASTVHAAPHVLLESLPRVRGYTCIVTIMLLNTHTRIVINICQNTEPVAQRIAHKAFYLMTHYWPGIVF